MRNFDKSLLAVAYEIWQSIPEQPKKYVSFIKLFRKKTGVSHREALIYLRYVSKYKIDK